MVYDEREHIDALLARVQELEQELVVLRANPDYVEQLEYKISNQKTYINNQTTKINELEKELSKERSHIKTCHIAMENHHKEMELKDSWVKHHQKSVEIAMADRKKLEEKIELYKAGLEAIESSFSLISTASYTEDSNGNRVMCGNEYPWVDRGIAGIKSALNLLGFSKSRRSTKTESSETTQVDTKKENT